jgi:hypothetical protein
MTHPKRLGTSPVRAARRALCGDDGAGPVSPVRIGRCTGRARRGVAMTDRAGFLIRFLFRAASHDSTRCSTVQMRDSAGWDKCGWYPSS